MSDTGGRTPSRRFVLALAVVPLLAVLLADGALVVRRVTDDQPAASPTHRPSPATTSSVLADRQETERADAIRALLARRGDAVMHHDEAEWLATVDPSQRKFRRQQRDLFRNLHDVPIASWSYTFNPHDQQVPNARTQRYGVPAWAPLSMGLRYRLRGFDRRPTNLRQFPTFVDRDGHWYIASFSDFAGEGSKTARELWDFGPVVVVHTRDVLVLGHPGAEDVMRSLAAEVGVDIPRVTAVWGLGWSRKVVVLVPSTQRELGEVTDDHGDLDRIAAVASAEVRVGIGRPDPVGDRIGINPANWSNLSLLGRRIVLTHELTHVATRPVTSASTPTWLAEGFADYVGYLDSGVPTSFVAEELAADVRSGRVPRHLPSAHAFRGANKKLSQAYEGAWMACRLIAQRWGQQTLVRFYRVVGRSSSAPNTAIAATMPQLLHVTSKRFEQQWREFLRAELG